MKPISNAAFYYCGVCMQDAENEKSVCLDVYAKGSWMREVWKPCNRVMRFIHLKRIIKN